MYMPLALGGSAAGVHLVDSNTIAEMSDVSSATAIDAVLLIPTRFSLGYWKRIDNRAGRPGEQDSLLIPESAFGHPGMGGSIGFADPPARLSFAYVMNKQGRGVGLPDLGNVGSRQPAVPDAYGVRYGRNNEPVVPRYGWQRQLDGNRSVMLRR